MTTKKVNVLLGSFDVALYFVPEEHKGKWQYIFYRFIDKNQ